MEITRKATLKKTSNILYSEELNGDCTVYDL